MIPLPHRSRHLLLAAILPLLALRLFPASGQAALLTNAAQVRALSPAAAASHVPVKLVGIFLGSTSQDQTGFIIMENGEGIYVYSPTGLASGIQPGEIVEVEGASDPGGFAPFVEGKTLRRISAGTLPPPRVISLGRSYDAALDAQWVTVSGVVRKCDPVSPDEIPKPPPGISLDRNHSAASSSNVMSKLVLASGGASVVVQVNAPVTPGSLVDAEVRINAMCFSRHNLNRQLLEPLLVMPLGTVPQILKPGPAEGFSVPLQTVASLHQFQRDSHFDHRVHVQGIVTLLEPGTSFWIRDNERGLSVKTHGFGELSVGDVVEVLGFPSMEPSPPTLEDAVFRFVSKQGPPTPIHLTNLVNVVQHDADLVQLDAKLMALRQIENGWAATLAFGESMVDAYLSPTESTTPPSNWQPGSVVRVVGICNVSKENAGPMSGISEPHSFSLRLRTAADITVLQPPAWWNLKHLIYLLGAVVVLLVLITIVVLVLARKRLQEQKRNRALAETEFAAILSERNRMAREIHDTLAQGLTATSFQLRLAKRYAGSDEGQLRHHLEAAQEMVHSSIAEARNSIWNMRSQILETHDMPQALNKILEQMVVGSGCHASFEGVGQPRRLAPVIENDLLRVGQEAITNAIRHGNPKNLKVRVEFGEKQLRLSIHDDGSGLDLANPPKSSGGFGLVGMRERAKKINGTVEIKSAPGKGTEVVFTIPLPD